MGVQRSTTRTQHERTMDAKLIGQCGVLVLDFTCVCCSAHRAILFQWNRWCFKRELKYEIKYANWCVVGFKHIYIQNLCGVIN